MAIDASEETDHPGRLINHIKKNFNLKVVRYGNNLIFQATTKIEKNNQLLFDYNDTCKKSIQENEWLLK